MTSWWVRSIANSLKLDDDDDDDNGDPSHAPDRNISPDPRSDSDQQHQLADSSSSSSTPTSRGVKEDLSYLTKTLTRQFWGVASFLAPPPEHSPSHSQISESKTSEPSDVGVIEETRDLKLSDEDIIAGIRSDIAEISGKFRTGISKLSSNQTVSEITKIASNFLQFGPEESLEKYKLEGAVAVTEEVLAFVKDIVMHPETWLDFPLPDDGDSDDFELSDAQQEHALAIEHLAPRLSALRIELCPGYMSESCFWKIYFVLLHPRLKSREAELLSTPEIVKARAMLTQELRKKSDRKMEPDSSQNAPLYSRGISQPLGEEQLSVPSPIAQSVPSSSLQTSAIESAPSSSAPDYVTEKHPRQFEETQTIDKLVVEEEPVIKIPNPNTLSGSSSKAIEEHYKDEDDDWLKEENPVDGVSGTSIPIGNDEDVSFSDLEDDDDAAGPTKKVIYGSDSSSKDSRDWVELRRSSTDSVKDNKSVEIRHVRSEQVNINARNSENRKSNEWLDVEDIDVM